MIGGIMKIAFIYDAAYPWHIGGAEAIHYNEAKELAKKHEVHFFSMRWPGMARDFTYEGIHYHSLFDVTHDSLYNNSRRSISEAVLFSMSMFNIFRYRFDVVVSNQFPVLHLPLVRIYCWIFRCSMVLHVDEVWSRKYWKSYLGEFKGTFAHRLNSLFLRGADFYIANSSSTAKDLANEGMAAEKLRCFSPVINSKAMSKIRASHLPDNTILFSGRLIKEKRLDLWLSILEKVNKTSRVPVHGLIVGSGPEEESVRNMIDSKGLSNVVSMQGFFSSSQELYSAIKGSLAMLNMSEREGLSVISIESVALGTPVFLPKYTPIPKEISEMCNVYDTEKIVSNITHLLATGNKKEYLHRKANLKQFLSSHIPGVYDKIFSILQRN